MLFQCLRLLLRHTVLVAAVRRMNQKSGEREKKELGRGVEVRGEGEEPLEYINCGMWTIKFLSLAEKERFFFAVCR